MKIFTAEQIRSWDQFTISNEPITSIQLMERASTAAANWISEYCKIHRKAVVFCGTGNNGGDGFAVARMLYLKGFDVDVFVNNPKGKFSEDATVNLKRLSSISGVSIRTFSQIEQYNFDDSTIIIDALFGTGLSRPLAGEYKEVVKEINKKDNIKIAIDVPSGLSVDGLLDDDSVVLKANYTLSFQCWKEVFYIRKQENTQGK